MNILICGGAGYIGSHVLKILRRQGYACIALDNLSTGYEWALLGAPFEQADILDGDSLDRVFSSHRIDLVMHFCARSLVGESVQNPSLYYENNVTGTLRLLDSMRRHGVSKLVFSSTAAIFGEPQQELIDEGHPKAPLNPYGHSKLMIEQILQDYAQAYGLDSVSLRYFNAAGADPDGELGEAHEPETHLIPNILRSLLEKQSGGTLKVFGNDYPTKDGTCIRDYIHVNDLASAHIAAMKYLHHHKGASAFNLGSRSGFSVMEVIQACETVSGRKVKFDLMGRRPGDPARLVADNRLAQEKLGWQPECSTLDHIIATAWRWHQSRHSQRVSQRVSE